MILGYRIRVTLADGTHLYETKMPGTYTIFQNEAWMHQVKPKYPAIFEKVVRVVKR